ncbi:MAG: hypothetical protein RL095_491 [Verrucomicrobiota bacterium]|jgi:predicted dehydrogenase
MKLNDQPHLPRQPRPICIIGAGGIVKDAHLPAYNLAAFPVFGITDQQPDRAAALAKLCGARAFPDLAAMIAAAPDGCVYDLAVPAKFFPTVLEQLPEGTAVLMQKPMGETLGEAREILAICHRKKLVAAVNLQLRFAPFVLMVRDALARGLIGDIRDFEVRLTVETPWHLWDFLKSVPAAEMIYHSVHYVDLIRSLLGNPKGVHAFGLPSELAPGMDMARSWIALNYGPQQRVNIATNHAHRFGTSHQESFLKLEGTHGAIKIRLGLLMDYPRGLPDSFEICIREDGQAPVWRELPIRGSWFPHAFIGTMGTLMRHLDDPQEPLPHSVEDIIGTMRVVDAAIRSSASGGTGLS